MSKFKQYLESVQEEKYQYDEFVNLKETMKKTVDVANSAGNKIKKFFSKTQPEKPTVTEQKSMNSQQETNVKSVTQEEIESAYQKLRIKCSTYANIINEKMKNSIIEVTPQLNTTQISKTIIENIKIEEIELSEIVRMILDKKSVNDFFEIEVIRKTFDGKMLTEKFLNFLNTIKETGIKQNNKIWKVITPPPEKRGKQYLELQ